MVVSTIISAGSILWGIYKGYAARSHLAKYIPKGEVVEAVEVIEAVEVPDAREITQYVKCKQFLIF